MNFNSQRGWSMPGNTVNGMQSVAVAGRHEMIKSLGALPAGSSGTVLALQGGHEFRSRMANLGFTAGTPVLIRQNYGHGPLLVALRGTLVALGRAEAEKVLVGVASEAGEP